MSHMQDMDRLQALVNHLSFDLPFPINTFLATYLPTHIICDRLEDCRVLPSSSPFSPSLLVSPCLSGGPALSSLTGAETGTVSGGVA